MYSRIKSIVMKTSTRWKHKQVFESSQESNTITIDGDRVEGISPKALLLSGLAGCSGIDVVEILQKKRVKFSDFSIDVETEQTEGPPKVFKDIFITFILRTDAGNEDKVKSAIELSLEKYCGVSAMLKKNSPIRYNLRILNNDAV
jgi:putative redox protein